ncbi:MAG: hypothetical protein K2G13_04735 [Muribaculaceae bacterium]|nr:hypothetical protein [Muribaculaceae bacterium]
MTQIVVTLENDADTTLLRRMIENMKGVMQTSIRSVKNKDIEEADAWMKKLHAIKRSIDPSMIDMSDERTRYIMSK